MSAPGSPDTTPESARRLVQRRASGGANALRQGERVIGRVEHHLDAVRAATSNCDPHVGSERHRQRFADRRAGLELVGMHLARLRFFLSSLHSEEQLRKTAEIVSEELKRLTRELAGEAVA